MKFNYYLQESISSKIGRLAVPLFFIASGYLFFINVNQGIYSIWGKIYTRFKTLVIPYIIACSFFVAFLALILLLGLRNYINGDIDAIFHQSLGIIFSNIYWKTNTGNAPLAFQLWFLRDLILIVSLTPAIYFGFLFLDFFFLLALYISALIFILPLSSFLTSLVWFSTGAFIAFKNLDINYQNYRIGLLLLGLYLLISVIELITDIESSVYISMPLIMVGILGIWFCYDFFVPSGFQLSQHKYLKTASSFTFFIYLFHEPTLNIVRKTLIIISGKNSMGYSLSYLISPLIFLFIATGIGLTLSKLAPKLYTVLVGGRK